MRLIGLAFLIFWLVPAAPAASDRSIWFEAADGGDVVVTLYFFWSETCPHCARAMPAVAALAAGRPWLRVESREVTASAENRDLFARLAATVGGEIQGVPSFFVCGRMAVGFDVAGRMAGHIASLADQCRTRLEAQIAERVPVPAAAAATPDADPAPTVELPWIGAIDATSLSLPVLTVVLGGFDAFNPCAFFVLLFLLSLLVHARSRARMLLVGGIFILGSGLLYFAFMAAWLNLFLMLESIEVVTRVAGAIAVAIALINVKDFFFFKQGISLSIPESAKPGLFQRMRGLISADRLSTLIAGTVVLAVVANTYELLCTSGFPLVYTRVLTLNELPSLTYYLYLALYNVVYVIPLLAIVIAFTVTLGARKLTERQGRVLKLMSGLMMLGLGLVLLVAPHFLDNVLTAIALIAIALVVTAFVVWAERLFATLRSRTG